MRIVVTHHNADLDALASMIAAKNMYDAVAVAGSIVSPPVKRYLALHKDQLDLTPYQEIDPTQVEEVIVVDVRDRRRIKEFAPFLEHARRIVAFDHHPDSEFDVKADRSVVEPVGACVTLLVEELITAGRPITPTDATLYLLGLYSDTGRLSYCTTQARDVAVALELIRRGANLKVMNRYLRRLFDDDQGALLVQMMNNAYEVSFDSIEVAFACATAPKFVRGAAAVVQQVLEFGGHDAIFGLIQFEKSKKVQIIGRSTISYLDVGQVLKTFGGGGHRGAAAAIVKKANNNDVLKRLNTVLEELPLTGTRVIELMSSPVHTLNHDLSLREAKALMAKWNVTGAPVLRDGVLRGIVSIRDVQRAERAGKLTLPVSSHMTHQVACIDFNEPVEDVLEEMSALDIGRMPVTRDGKMIGIVTRTDLLRVLYMFEADDSELAD